MSEIEVRWLAGWLRALTHSLTHAQSLSYTATAVID